ncbi:hypothetical protein [Thermomonospora amylolytica]|uniref:hypothetical protein n=1 Tax=Thermomonospora amylolytica TaxID=1411117 RepID=UPI000E6CC15A|nr:hypothetical protein [Thermomonospora amylolytica]
MIDNTTSKPEPTQALADTYRRLVQLERTIGALADATEDAFISWGFQQADAADARDALRTAPSLADTAPLPPNTEPLPDTTVDSLTALTAGLRRELITLSEQVSDPLDQHACLTAALFVGHLNESLR